MIFCVVRVLTQRVFAGGDGRSAYALPAAVRAGDPHGGRRVARARAAAAAPRALRAHHARAAPGTYSATHSHYQPPIPAAVRAGTRYTHTLYLYHS